MALKLMTADLSSAVSGITAGERILLSGTVYTARDAAHKRFREIIESGGQLPFQLKGAVIYYAGPTPAPPGLAIGSCGPTTSSRMDTFAPQLYDLGVSATIGKGQRSPEVAASIIRNRAFYFAALGGAGALAAQCITSCEVIAFPELGCESVKRLMFKEFPLITALAPDGTDIYSRSR